MSFTKPPMSFQQRQVGEKESMGGGSKRKKQIKRLQKA